MPSLKIYPPSRLPNTGVNETQFNMWQEELEVYISQDPEFKLFLPTKTYASWSSYEENSYRIHELKANDVIQVNNDHRQGWVITQADAEVEMMKNWII